MRHEEKTTSGEPESVTATYRLLTDPRRRALLRHLYTRDQPVAVADLATHLAASEHDGDGEPVPADEIDRAYVSLHHVHLPKLEDAGAIEYDHDRRVVTLTGSASRLTDWLESTSDE